MFYNKVIAKWYKIKKTIMKVINNLNSVISNFLCEGHCSFKVLIFFFCHLCHKKKKSKQNDTQLLLKSRPGSFQEQINSLEMGFLWNRETR